MYRKEKKGKSSGIPILFSIFISSTFKKKLNQIFLANDDNDKI